MKDGIEGRRISWALSTVAVVCEKWRNCCQPGISFAGPRSSHTEQRRSSMALANAHFARAAGESADPANPRLEAAHRPVAREQPPKRHSSHHLKNLSDPYQQWASFLLFLLVLISFSFFFTRRPRQERRIGMAEYLIKSAAEFGSSIYKNG